MPNTGGRRSLAILLALGVITFLATNDAHAQNGSWTWGPPGFTAGMSPQDRQNVLINQGLADPNVNYWTPFWSGAGAPNIYTGVADTSFRNQYAVDHDINARFGIPVIGYLDIFTPLFGTNELRLGAGLSMIWDSIVNTVSSMWNSLTSIFQSDYTSYNSQGFYNNGWGNGFSDGYGGYGGRGTLNCSSCH